MPFRGRLEDTAVLDVVQILAYSQQSGTLAFGPSARDGAVVFDSGNVVSATSSGSLDLFVKSVMEREPRKRMSLRRVQVLTALRDLFDLTEGDYDFTPSVGPVLELSALDIRVFYDDGALDTGDLLLALERAMEEVPPDFVPERATTPEPLDVVQKRRFERFAPIIIRGELASRSGPHPGYLTNLSVGGTFYHTDDLPGIDELVELTFELPWNMGTCCVRAKVVWLRSGASGAKRGAGLYFHEFQNDSRERISAYLEKFQSAVDDVLVL